MFAARFIIALAGLMFAFRAHADPATIKIGVIGPVTGKASEDMGLSIMGGAQVFLADVNQIGGILGQRVELVDWNTSTSAPPPPSSRATSNRFRQATMKPSPATC
jgi:ABC-type branched-subunit amino acid transport system substrate-binding protein